MKKIVLITLLIFSHCSFDNKTGIWENNNQPDVKAELFKNFRTVYFKDKSFKSIIPPPANLKIKLDPITSTNTWLDEYYNEANNFNNFDYQNTNDILLKSRKLTRYRIKKNFLYDGSNVISSDMRGNILIYSTIEKKIIFKFNFYQKKYKKVKKNLNIAVEKNIVYVLDNIGYLYALDYKKKKIIWAENYKVPFRSNIKVTDNLIIVANQNNYLYVVNKLNGERLKSIPTEEIILKNKFINSIAASNEDILYLNTYGSLYSINKNNLSINWFVNLNQSTDIRPSNLFYSNPIIIDEDKVIISTDLHLYILNKYNGSVIFRIPITSSVIPQISGKNIFFTTADNLLVCINLITGKISYSVDVSKSIAVFLKTKNKSIIIKSLSIVNNRLFVILDNSYVVKFNPIGRIQEIKKFPQKIDSFPIFIDKKIFFLTKNKKLVILN